MAEEKTRILVVEDDPDTAESYRLVLEGSGYEVRHAVTSSAAWQVVEAWHPRLILLDVVLAEGTEGLSFLWDLRRAAERQLAETPVLLVSAMQRDSGLRIAPRSGLMDPNESELLPVSGFLEKPVPPATLLDSVRGAMRNGNSGYAAEAESETPAPEAPSCSSAPNGDRHATEPLVEETAFDLADTSAGPLLYADGGLDIKPVVSPDVELREFRTPSGATLAGPAELLRRRGATDLASALAVSVPLCASWNYAVRRKGGGYQATLENGLASLRLMSEMGFHFVEVEGYGRSGVSRLYDERHKVKEKLDEWGLRSLVYCFIDSAFAHTDFEKRARPALDRFQNLAIPTATTLGAEMIRVNSFTPAEALYVDPAGEDDEFQIWPPYSDEGIVTSELKLPADFELRPTWDALVAGCKIAADLAGRAGLALLLEPRRRELCETIADLINLCNDVDLPDFYVVLDTAHANYGEEFLVAVRKLAELPRRPGRILCVHVSDNDGSSYLHGTVGDYEHQGGIDWHQFAEFLKQPVFRDGKPFAGPLVVDCGSKDMTDLEESIIVSARRLQEVLTAHDIPWLI